MNARTLIGIGLLWGIAAAASAQVREDDPSPSDRLPVRPLLDDDQMAPRTPRRPLVETFDASDIADEDELETDRDSFTPATSTVAAHRFLFETAYSFLDNRDSKETHSFPEFVARYGLNDWFELRFGASYEVGGAGSDVSTGGGFSELDAGKIESESQLSYGFKINATQQDGWIPRSSVILAGSSPTSGPEATSQFVGTYVAGWKLANDWQWDTALRFATDEFEADRHSLWAPSTVIKVPLGERWKVHGEYFGIVTHGLADPRSQHFFSPGAHYLISNDLEIGVRVGWGLNEQSSNFFSNVGLGWRF